MDYYLYIGLLLLLTILLYFIYNENVKGRNRDQDKDRGKESKIKIKEDKNRVNHNLIYKKDCEINKDKIEIEIEIDKDEIKVNEKEIDERIDEIKGIDYVISIKKKNELTPFEFKCLETQYNELLYKKGSELYENSLKENSVLFIAYDTNTGNPIGQAAVLLLDTHDFWGAFSKIRNLNLDTQSVILYNVCVSSSYRNKGIATALINSIHSWLPSLNRNNIILFVDKENHSAKRLYEKMGYYLDKTYYSGNSSEIMLRCKIT